METAYKNTKYKSLDDLPAIFKVKDLAEIMGVNQTKAYEIAKRQDFHASIKIGRRIMIIKEQFQEWLKKATLCEQFKNGHENLSKKEKRLYETAFWEAVNFLKKMEAEENDRRAKIKALF
ncbi:MAG: helix-turn-helix domain-containing protein [Clostridiales bacterium]|nr:helix-turn-helix domain-containing protein [Clostridiales bacterium]